ncbi:MAG: hypothetical protein JSV61_06405 [Anaerolineales bacterium]|nr:MAG: hypothetical protein JSV61_06405 [Anaerolineales bacterium]
MFENPSFLGEDTARFGSQYILMTIDARSTTRGWWEVFTHGDRKPTGINTLDWAFHGVSLALARFCSPVSTQMAPWTTMTWS